MVHTKTPLDSRFAAKPVDDEVTVGVDIGCTYAKRVLTDAQGRRLSEPREVRVRDYVGKGSTELVLDLLADLPVRARTGGLTAACTPDENGNIILTNVPGLGIIHPGDIEAAAGLALSVCNDVEAFVLGSTSTEEFDILRPAREMRPATVQSPIRTGLFFTSGTNSAAIRYIPALGIWVSIPAETGWVGLQQERHNLMEKCFYESIALRYSDTEVGMHTATDVGAELITSLGSGIENWHYVLRDCGEKVLDHYADHFIGGKGVSGQDLRPSRKLLSDLEAAGPDIGPVFSRRALEGDLYAQMVMTGLCNAQGAYCRAVALGTRTTLSEGLWINSPLLADPTFRDWMLRHTAFEERFLGTGAASNGRRFTDQMDNLPLYVVTDRYVVPAGAATNVGVERVINGETSGS